MSSALGDAGPLAAAALVGAGVAYGCMPCGAKLKAQPKLKLVYFDGPGKAEGTRLACAVAGLELEDYRFASREEFMAMKTSGELRYGQVPCLFVDGEQVNQSSCILRTVGRLGGLYPEDDLVAAGERSLMSEMVSLVRKEPLLRQVDWFKAQNK